AEGLALKVHRHGEDLQTVLFGQIDPLFGIGFSAPVTVTLAQLEFPARLLPAVEAGILQELQPLVHGNVAELAANEADLVVRSPAIAVRGGLLVAHGWLVPFGQTSRRLERRLLTIHARQRIASI